MNTRSKRCGLFALSLVALFTGLSVLLSGNSYADSTYSPIYHISKPDGVWNVTLDTKPNSIAHNPLFIEFSDTQDDSGGWYKPVSVYVDMMGEPWTAASTDANWSSHQVYVRGRWFDGSSWQTFMNWIPLVEGVTNGVTNYDTVFQQGEPKVTCAAGERDLGKTWVSEILGKNSDFDTAYNSALDLGTGWSLIQGVYSGGSYKELTVFVTPAGSQNEAYFMIDGAGHKILVQRNVMRATLYCSGDNLLVDFNTSTGSIRDIAGDYGSYQLKPVFVNVPVTYPSGYAGTQIPDSYGEQSDTRSVIKPDFAFQIAKKHIAAQDHNTELPTYTPEAGYTVTGYYVEWKVYSCPGYDEVTHQCADGATPVLKDLKELPQNTEYTFDVAEYGGYLISARYMIQQCYRYASYPATPDYCFYADLGAVLPDYNFTPTEIWRDINGMSYTGDTTGLQCDVAGFCPTQNVPCNEQDTFMMQVVCTTNKMFNFGVLNPSLNAFKNLFASFIVPANPTCKTILNDVTYMGSTFPFSQIVPNACSRVEQLNQQFPIVNTAVNFTFGMLLFYLIIRIFNTVLNNRKNDIIQGVE